MTVTRFAPSPTGLLHLGHAYAAWFAQAHATGGRFLVRIEDIDRDRCRPEYEAAILDDLAWLGLDWARPVMRQSARLDAYRAALDRLSADGLLYPCFCSRRDIAAASAAPHLVQAGPDGPLYPGTCRALAPDARQARIARGDAYALRLDMQQAQRRAGPLTWTDRGRGVQDARPDLFGDIVLGRKDTPASYHLAVVIDDAAQGIDLVTRGDDLFAATHVHRLLQATLGLPVPQWHHHGLVRDDSGRRLAKRAPAFALRDFRAAGRTAAEVLDEARRRTA
ncbi:MAG: tRNA glutamyl-Q(34) synthetase GluQRS [Rhodospirillaceae bacterium]